MPDNYASKKEEYTESGIVFCPHKDSTGISVNVNAVNISNSMAVGTFMGSSDGDDEESKKIDEESFNKPVSTSLGQELLWRPDSVSTYWL